MRRAGNEAVAVSLGTAAMLVVAATIESYVRQSYLSNEGRFALAGATAVFWAAYFLRQRLAERAVRARSTASAR